MSFREDPVEFVSLSREIDHHPGLREALAETMKRSGPDVNIFSVLCLYAEYEPEEGYYDEKALRKLCTEIERRLYMKRTGLIIPETTQ